MNILKRWASYGQQNEWWWLPHGTAKRLNISQNPDLVTPLIPGYTIKSIIGHGGFATVYLALQHNLNRDVALKVMSPILTRDPDICSRFLREACDTASVSNHPNIVTIHDVGQVDAVYYISMQFLQGPSLKQLIDTRATLPTAQALVHQLADALKYIHQKGFVHRDIKPANVLFNEAGQAILSDFGVASLNSRTTQLTHIGTIIGTAKYMSPEQCRGDSTIDARSDLYSLGIILFELLNGRAPFEASATMAIMLKHVNDPVPELPAEHSRFQPLVNKLMAKQAYQRFQSADELIQAIERLGGGRRLHDSTRTRRNDHSDKHSTDTEMRTSTVIGVAVAIALVLGGLLLFLNTQPQTLLPAADLKCQALTQADTQKREALLELASMHAAIGRLTHPPGANALEAYSLALDIDPCNQSILDAIKKTRSQKISL